MEIEGSIKFADLPEGAQSAVRNVAAYFTMQFDNNDWGPFLEEVTPYSIDADAALVPAALGTLMTYSATSRYRTRPASARRTWCAATTSTAGSPC